MKSALTVTSLFCGLGGLDLGFQMQGFKTVWANDISPNAVASHSRNFCSDAICADITQLPVDQIPSADVIIGGPPCQAFSLVGRRLPDDPRSQLVFSFYDVVRVLRPEAFVMENVPGMAASRVDGIRLPELLATEFQRLGYFVTLMPLIATDYLVPQRRKRLFLVGCRIGPVDVPDPDLFARECIGVERQGFDISARAAIGDLGPCTAKGGKATYVGQPSAFSSLMRLDHVQAVSLHECPRMSETDLRLLEHIPPGGNYRDIPDRIATGRVLKFKRSGGRTTTYGRLHPDMPSFTVNTYFRRPNVGCNFHYDQPRLITPREAMRFQALPDWMEVTYGSQDERNSYIGNAVPSLLARAVAWTLSRTLEGRSFRA